MNANPIVENYIQSVRTHIYNLAESEKFISSLRESIYEFAESRDDLTLEDLIAEFGTPDQVADEYLSDNPAFEPDKVEKVSRRKKIIIGAIVICILIVIGIFIWVTHAPTDVPEQEILIQQ